MVLETYAQQTLPGEARMKKYDKHDKKQKNGIDWTAIFQKHPELEAPGYWETVKAMYSKEPNEDD